MWFAGVFIVLLWFSCVRRNMVHGDECNDHWMSHNGNCYKLVTNWKNYADAARACERRGTHLLSILNQEESTYFSQMGNDGQWWAGLQKINDSWWWDDGSVLSYTNWENGAEDRSGNCLQIDLNTMQWRPEDCYQRHKFICKEHFHNTTSEHDHQISDWETFDLMYDESYPTSDLAGEHNQTSELMDGGTFPPSDLANEHNQTSDLMDGGNFPTSDLAGEHNQTSDLMDGGYFPTSDLAGTGGCMSVDCHMGTCVDTLGIITCICDEGWSGSHCRWGDMLVQNDGPKSAGDEVVVTFVISATNRSHIDIGLDFGDDTSSNYTIQSDSDNLFTHSVTHIYHNISIYRVTARILNVIRTIENSTEVLIYRMPTVNISGGGISWDVPMEMYSWQKLTLQGHVTTNCPVASSVTFYWMAYTVGDSSDELDISSSTDKIALVLDRYALDYGSYLFVLTVKVQMVSDSSPVTASAFSWVKVIPSSLQPVLTGGSSKSIGVLGEVYMSGELSYDPDEPPDRTSATLTYTWFCTKTWDIQLLPLSYNDDFYYFSSGITSDDIQGCFPGAGAQLPNVTAILTFPATALEWDTVPAAFTFRLFVSKEGRDPVYTDQRITILQGDPPNVEVSCYKNCGQYLNPSEKLVLKSTCSNCVNGERLSYMWELHTGDSNNPIQGLVWDRDTTTGYDSYNLVIKPNVFSSVTQDLYEISLILSRLDGTVGLASYAFMTNAAPTAGQCVVSPTEGVVLQTPFSITCTGFSDPDVPLTYRIHTAGRQGDIGSLVYEGYESSVSGLYLPVGDPDNTYTLRLLILVIDAYSSSTQVSLTLKVTEPAVVELNELTTLTGDDSQLDDLITSGDVQAATNLISSVSSLLNRQPDTVVTQGQREQRKQLRESLVESLASVDIQTMGSLQQSTSALSQLTSVSDELSDSAQMKAATALTQMSGILVQQTSEGASSSDVQQTGQLLVASVSNILGSVTTADTNVTALDQDEAEEKARNVTMASLSAIDDIKSALLSSKVAGEEPTVMSTDKLVVQLSVNVPSTLLDSQISLDLGSSTPTSTLYIPANVSLDGTTEIGTEMVQFQDNPYTWSNTSDTINSRVIQLVLRNHSTNEISVSNLSQPISIHVPYSSSPNERGANITLVGDSMAFVEMNMTQQDPDVHMLLHLNSIDTSTPAQQPGSESSPPSILLKFLYVLENNENRTNVSSSMNMTDVTYIQSDQLSDYNNTTDSNLTQALVILEHNILLSEPLSMSEPWHHKVSRSRLPEDGRYVIQLQLIDSNAIINLTLVTMHATCNYWQTEQELWSEQGCQVGSEMSLTHLHCECSHLTSFGGGFIVMPNKLNLLEDIAKFATFWENPVGIIAVATILGIYVAGVIYARRKDNLYKLKALPIDLLDNDSNNKYVYLLTVYTGTRRGAGTTSLITLTLHGTEASSSAHVLECTGFPVLQRGDINFFLIKTPQTLGVLKSLRVWHHNMGDNPSWYLSRAIVLDVQSKQEYYFQCNSWLAVDIGDCLLDQTFLADSTTDLKKLNNLFVSNASSGFGDNHMWFSSLSRHAHSTFTCVQRVSCCLCLFMSYMLCNIMFFGIDPEPGEQKMDLGPMTITWTDLRIGFQSSLLMFPINFLIVFLFRNTRPRHPIEEPWKNTMDIASELVLHSSSIAQQGGYVQSLTNHRQDQPLETVCESSENGSECNPEVKPLLSDSESYISIDSVIMSVHKLYENDDTDRSASESMQNVPHKIRASHSKNMNTKVQDSVRFFLDEAASEVNLAANKKVGWPTVNKIFGFLTHLSPSKTSVSESCQSSTASDTQTAGNRINTVNNVNVNSEDGQGVDDNSCAISRHKLLDMILKSRVVMADPAKLAADDTSESNSNEMFLPAQSSETIDKALQSTYTDDEGADKELLKHVNVEDSEAQRDIAAKTKQQKKCLLPWWCVFIGWFLVVVVTAVCGFFTILYTFNYGLDLSIQWLKALVISFVSDLIVSQPCKVLLMALFVSLILRRTEQVNHINPDVLKTETQHEDTEKHEISNGIQQWLREDWTYKPPTTTQTVNARERKHIQERVYAIGVELVRYTIFLYLVMLIAYAQRDDNIYWQNKAIKDLLINTDEYQEIDSVDNYILWLNTTLVEAAYDEIDEHFMSNGVSYKLASPRLRQLRVHKRRGCPPGTLTRQCTWQYSSDVEDTQDYNGTWSINETGTTGAYRYTDMWQYKSPAVAGGANMEGVFSTYGGGGYVAELGATRLEAYDTINYIYTQSWIDSNTAVIIIDVSVYTANVNLISLVMISMEVAKMGGVWMNFDMYTMKMYHSTGGLHYFVLAFQIVYCLYTLFFIVYEVRKIHRIKSEYLRNAWNLLEVGAILSSLSIIGLYAAHAVEVQKAVKLFNESGSKQQTFHKAVLLDRALLYMFSLLVSIGLIKFLHLLRFNPMIYKFACILRKATMPLTETVIALTLAFTAFGLFMYVIAGHEASMFRNMTVALVSLFSAMLGEFEMEELTQLHPFWGPFLFLTFIFVMMILLYNFLFVLLFIALDQVNQNPQPAEDAQLLWLLVDNVKQWLGIRDLKPAYSISQQLAPVTYPAASKQLPPTAAALTQRRQSRYMRRKASVQSKINLHQS